MDTHYLIAIANTNINGTEILVGIDIGDTFIKGGILTIDGKVLKISKIKTPVSRKINDVCAVIKNFIVSLCNKAQTSIDHILGIGIACLGAIDVYNVIVIDSSNLAWYNEPLKKCKMNFVVLL